MPTEPPTLAEPLGDAANVLLVAPPRSDAGDRACVDLLTVADPAEEAVLSVTLSQPPADRLGIWERHTSTYPPQSAFVGVESTVVDPNGPTDGLAQSVPSSTALAVDRIDHPGDLLQLGGRISDRLAEWSGSGRQIVMCLHSLSTLAQYADPERLFRFLHVLTGRVASVGGVAHYHLEPDAHDGESVSALESLFDVTVELDAAGERTVRR